MNILVKLRFITKSLCLVGFSLILLTGCQGNIRTGEVEIHGVARLKMPAFPQTGPHAVLLFSEMHYQPSYRSQEKPRLLPPSNSVPISGVGIALTSLEEYAELEMPSIAKSSLEQGKYLYQINCMVCHGSDLKGIRNIGMISVEFYFESPSFTDQTEPTVSIRIANGSEGNDLYTDTQNSYEHTWNYDYVINNLTSSGNVTMSADSQEDFLFQLEVDGEYIFVEVVYDDSNAIFPGEDDTLDYEINITMTTWSIEDINEVQTV